MTTTAPALHVDSEPAAAEPIYSAVRFQRRQLAWSALVGLVPVAYLLVSNPAVPNGLWWAAGLLLLGLVGVVVRRSNGNGSSAAIALIGFRIGVCLWVLTAYAGRPSWAIAVVSTAIAAAAIISEEPVRRLSGAFVPLVSNMPGLVPAPPKLNHRQLALHVSAGALAVGVGNGVVARFLPEARWPSWLWLMTASVMLVVPVRWFIRATQRILAGRRIERRMTEAIQAYAPEFVLYTARPDDASYQVLMWLPYLQRTGRRFLIVARYNEAATAIAAQTDVPVLVRRGVAELDDIVQPSLRAAFYVNASSGNGAFVRYNQLIHVYLGHGDSDKPPSYNPTHAMYDRVFAAGQAAIERYAAHGVSIDSEKFEVVGRPQVESVEPGVFGVPVRTVLYAPTWRGHVSETLLYSLPIGERIVAALLRRGLTVIFRPHPFSHDFPEDVAAVNRITDLLRADADATGRPHLFGPAADSERGIIECINASDAMVSDVSSVVSDYLFSEKPFAMVAGHHHVDDFIRNYPVAEAAYVIDGAAENIEAVLDQMLGSDPERISRRQMRTHYLGDFSAENYSQAFVNACNRIVDTPAPRTLEESDSPDEGPRGRAFVLDRLRTQFAIYGKEFCYALGGVGVFALGLAGQPTAATWVALLLVAAVVFLSRRGVLSVSALNNLLGILAPARIVLALALLPCWPAGQLSPIAVIAIILLVLLTAIEAPVRYGWGGPGTGVANLAGAESPPLPRIPRGSCYIANLAALGVGWLSVLLGGTAWLLISFVLVGLALAVSTVRAGARRLRQLEDSAGKLPEIIERYAPSFAVYFASTIGADYQVGMWLPYFKRIGARFVIVTRTVSTMQAIAKLDDSPVIYRPTLRSLEDVICPSMTTAFYVNNAVRNTHLIERRELTHVWLNHGDSEKPACFNPVHAIYDKLFAAGQAGIDRYARHGVNIPREKFEIVGRPQVELIKPARGPIRSLAPATVLYAPTWKGPYADSRVYSLPQGERIVEKLLDLGLTVIFRAHPFNENYPESRAAMRAIGNLLAADRKRTGRQHLWGDVAQRDMSVEDCFNASDAMIADVSAVISDYLKSEKPYAIVSVGRAPEQLLRDAPAARAAYVLREDLSNLDQVCADLLVEDPLAAARRETKIYYLGSFEDETYADGFLNAARRVIAQNT